MRRSTKTITFSAVSAALILANSSIAYAQNDLPLGAFIGISAGASGIETGSIGLATNQDTAHTNGSAKISAGYWFSRNWGIEGSYVPIGRFEQTYGTQTFRGRTDSYAVSLLGRLPINARWSLVGKLNLAYNRTRDKGSTLGVPEFDKLRGSSTSLVLPGLEVNYRINDSMSVLFEIDPRGTAGDKVSIGYAGFGIRTVF